MSIISPIKDTNEHYFMWQSIITWQKAVYNFDLLLVEESGKGKEFLEELNVDGWKLCKTKEFPAEGSFYPPFHGFIKDGEYLLCYKIKKH